MKDEIKEIFDIWADDDGEIVVHYIDKNNNKQEYKMITRENLLDYITNLQEEVKSANESITWWHNRFSALYKRLNKKYEDAVADYEEQKYIIRELEKTLLEKIEATKTIKDILGENAKIVNPHIEVLETEYNCFLDKLKALKEGK